MQNITSEKKKKKKALKRRKRILKWSIITVSVFLVLFLFGYIYSLSSRSSSNYAYDLPVDTISSSNVSERDRINAQITAKNRNYRNNWFDYISVDRSFSYYGIGGIEDLKIIATNKTDYLINELTVRLCYVIDNGSCYKYEDVIVYNVPPNSSRTVDAPSSSRGKEVGLEIINIYSDKMNFLYNPDVSTVGVHDPYFKK